MPATIEILGIGELVNKLGQLGAMNHLEPAMRRAVLRLQRDMADYPPKPKNSSYRRTGTLGRKWTTKVTKTHEGLTGKVGNNTYYAPYVQHDRFKFPKPHQTLKHLETGWITDAQAIEKEATSIIVDFTRIIKRVIDEG